MRLVVTGYRHWLTSDAVWRALEYQRFLVHSQDPWFSVAFGDCLTGVDALAKTWCQAHMGDQTMPQVVFKEYVADWDRFGLAAGPRRNIAMVDEVEPDLVLAFMHPRSKGTRQCAEYARSKGIMVHEIWEGRAG